MTIATPTPTEIAMWGNQRMQVADQYGNTSAQLAFQRAMQQGQESQDWSGMNRQFDRTRETLPGQFARRGLLNSGIYGNALTQYAQDRYHATAGLALKYQQSLGQLNLNQQQAQTNYTSGTSQIYNSETARRQELASQLAGVV